MVVSGAVSSAQAGGSDGGSRQALELSVVIPCLNEAKTIANCIGRARAAMDREGISGEVVVSDNGSTDGSVEVAEAAGARVVRCPVKGYGAALQWGFAAAQGHLLLMGDADESYDFGQLGLFVARLRQGADFVMGSRLRGTIDPGAMPTLNRHLGTPVLTWILNRLFATQISDCNCGLRGLSREAYLRIGAVAPGMEFASEMVVKAALAGISIDEVPIAFHRDARGRPPHLRPWRDGWRHLRLLLWHAPDQLMTQPGLLLVMFGAALVVWQLFGPYRVGNWLFDLHIMVLGLTIALLGLPALAMGVAVHAITPERRLRRAFFLGDVNRWFTFDRAMVVAALLFVPGLCCDVAVLVHWLGIHRGPLTAIHTRLALAGTLFIAMGFQAALLGLLVGAARSALAPTLFAGPSPSAESRRAAVARGDVPAA